MLSLYFTGSILLPDQLLYHLVGLIVDSVSKFML